MILKNSTILFIVNFSHTEKPQKGMTATFIELTRKTKRDDEEEEAELTSKRNWIPWNFLILFICFSIFLFVPLALSLLFQVFPWIDKKLIELSRGKINWG